MSREYRWLARQLRPRPERRRSLLVRVLDWVGRYVVELVGFLTALWVWRLLAGVVGGWPSALLLAAVCGLLVWWRRSRRVLSALAGVVVTRHRVQTALAELRLTTRAGRPPLELWIGPTPVGERVWLWCRAGISAEDLADEADHLRSACVAREVRIARDPRWASLVRLDVIRRDPLGTARTVTSPLADASGSADA